MRNPDPVRLRRSVHFVPGPVEKMLQKALAGEADTLVIDLEDAVAPAGKHDARRVIAEWLSTVDFERKEVAIRLNPLDTPWGLGDLEAMLPHAPHLLMIPKAERKSDVEALDTLITCYLANHKVDTEIGLLLLGCETALGTTTMTSLAGIARVVALTWGAEDLAAALGATDNRDETGTYLNLFAAGRDATLIAANINDVQPIDSVYVNLSEPEALRKECEIARNMGFTGKLTIHPEQIPIVNEVFSPNPDAVAKARRLVEAFAEARQEGRNAFRFEGQMVDAPHLTRAKKLIQRANELGAI